MRIKTIKLRGFIGVKAGLGLEELHLDFSGLNGLIALQGANGMGKTTLLENMQPYRMLPSREGTLKSNCYLKDSFKEMTFDFGGHQYRTLIKIDATTKRSDEGFIYKDGSDRSEVDGKVSNYDAYINKLLGSSGLFFSSIFSAQNGPKLSDMKPSDLKNLFAEFLRLDRYIRWEETSKGAIRICKTGLEAVNDALDTLDTKIRMLGNPRGDLKAATKLWEKTGVDIAEKTGPLEDEAKRIEALKKEVIEIAQKRKRLEDLTKTYTDLSEAQIKADDQYRTARIGLEDRRDELEKTLKEKIEILQNKEDIEAAVLAKKNDEKAAEVLRESIKNFATLITDTKERVAKHRLDIVNLQHAIDSLSNDEKLAELRQDLSVLRKAYEDHTQKVKGLLDDPELLSKQLLIDSMEKSAAVLDNIDPGCTSEVCGLITASLEAKEKLPETKTAFDALLKSKQDELNVEMEDLIKRGKEQSKLVEDHIKSLDKIKGTKEAEIVALNEKIQKREIEIGTFVKSMLGNEKDLKLIVDGLEDLTATAAKLPQLVSAEEVVKVTGSEIDTINDDLKRLQKQHETAAKASLKKMAEIEQKKAEIIIDEDAESNLAAAETRLKELNEAMADLLAERQKLETLITKIQEEIKSLETMEAEVKVLQEKKAFITSQISEWDYLRVACGKDGLRALEIDAVAPVITKYANDLLSMTFGPGHTVKFATQDEDGKEVLLIIVILPDGSETPLHKLSGGEKVWILKALRLAQTLISQEKSGRHFETALMDEEDGALSSKNAINFIKLYRSFKEMAVMDSCFYITHRQEAVAMADSILRFEPGKISIV